MPAVDEQPMSGQVRIGVLGPLGAWAADGQRLALPGPRHREVLARLVVARGRVVPVGVLVGDLWADPPAGAVSAVRTFVAALRRALEPGATPRNRARILVTDGTGYRVRSGRGDVDAWDFEDRVRSAPELPWPRRAAELQAALGQWRGPALSDFTGRPWAAGEAARLTELRLTAAELLAEARLRLGQSARALADLRLHLHEHPGREQAWLLTARALQASGQPEDALALLRRARARLAGESGLDPTARLAELEQEILLGAEPAGPRLWRESAAVYAGTGPRRRQAAEADLLRGLAVSNAAGLNLAQAGRAATAAQLTSLRDPELAAQLLTRVEVPGIWATLDDPARSAQVVNAARACLDQLGEDASPALRARLLALIGLESRGTRGAAGPDAARQAEALGRDLGDPAILVQALNARFLQSFQVIGRWPERAASGDELITLSRRHDLPTYQILGHLIGLQAAAAGGDVAGADQHAAAADGLGARQEADLVGVFTTWYYALRTALTGQDGPAVDAAYERALATLDGCGMPGVSDGLEPLTRLCLRLRAGQPVADLADLDFGPNAAYARPLLADDTGTTRELLRAALAPPPDHLAGLRWALLGEAARRAADPPTARAVHRALTPAAGELIGAGTGMLSLGPVAILLDALAKIAGELRWPA
jgi:DNA-binding SARP family transcriptional activator